MTGGPRQSMLLLSRLVGSCGLFSNAAGVETCPSDFVARHLVVAPACITVWNRRRMIVACTSGTRRSRIAWKTIEQRRSVARDVRLFQAEAKALLAGDPEADAHAMQVQSTSCSAGYQSSTRRGDAREQRPAKILRCTRFDGVLGMLRELSICSGAIFEAKRAELQTRLLTISAPCSRCCRRGALLPPCQR